MRDESWVKFYKLCSIAAFTHVRYKSPWASIEAPISSGVYLKLESGEVLGRVQALLFLPSIIVGL